MQKQSRYFLGLLSEVKTHPLITLGFSLFWLWVWLVAQSSFLNSSILVIPLQGIARWVVPLAAYGVVFMVLGILYATRRIAPHSTLYRVSVGITTSFGAASMALFSNFPTTSAALTSIFVILGGLLAGGGTACIHTEWGRLMSSLGSRKTIIHITSGTVGAMILILLYPLLPPVAEWIILVLLPAACVAILIQELRPSAHQKQKSDSVGLYLPWRLLPTSFIQGTAFGILQTVLLIVGSTRETMLVSVVGSVLGAVAVFVVVFAFKLDFNQLIYHVGFVILAASFVIMAAAGSFFMGGWLINALGYRFIDILMWALCVHLIKHRGLPVNWVFPVATCALILGQVFGSIVGQLVRSAYSSQGGGLEVLAVIMIFCILAAALFLANKQNLQKGWGMIRPSDESEQQGDSFVVSCTLVADGFELTARELEVFVRLARGQQRALIASELFLASETVKTHTRNIYRKMQLHSQEELMRLVKGD
ncbi:MAG: helix-turn-helix transcriptional regulator [Coriobacteriales bacterium]|jgi:DNA-binding CsgD family transcriptional regulator|nr:helix-turn-helix transcriptional regulator [Coriobacteriales bacterium]